MGDHMSNIFPPSDEFKANAIIDKHRYEEMYSESISDPDAFWSKHGMRVDWIKPFTKIKNVSYQHPNISIKWFEDGELNVSANCIDRHLDSRGEQAAIIWEGDNPSESKHVTYRELHQKVSKLGNVYKNYRKTQTGKF